MVVLGLCSTSRINWNYYLEIDNGEIYYEGYANSQWRKDGEHWKNEERLKLNRTQAVLKMNSAENSYNYPIGMLTTNMFDPG